jgi:hypothetical protein
MSPLKRRLDKLSPPDWREVRVLHAMPDLVEIAAKRQEARELAAQGFEVLLIERVLVDPPVRASATSIH